MQVLTRTALASADPATQDLDIATLLGAQAWNRLPRPVQHRFTQAHQDTAYAGTLDLSCSVLGSIFAWLTRPFGGPLTAIRRDGVAALVRVHSDGRGGVVWERHLALAGRGKARVVRSTKHLGPDGTLIEQTDGGLAMELDVFEEDQALVFRSRRYFLALGRRWRIPLPMALTPGVCRVEHRDESDGRFRFTLSMVHPWWGRTFYQTGVFSDPKKDQT